MSVRVSYPVLGTLDTTFQPDFGMYKDREGWRIYGFWFPFDNGAPVRADIFVDDDVIIEFVPEG